ncbi:hypothetical protein MAC_02851 [Metarhizium acridum CQMa 102]|uniref:Uncharacterized protein n=1 Tax=Metarhizium acridum (strain CQMa 102) TaxID=655827 RepID=E9DZ03_METAQ|nr:uncharacterized protein MAC_02851 [Metarhizium acridum CQMa 102]EFY91180.1 hypothetical protein MAC_02851 [Metarhizium acridum CQMa 102]
MANNNADNRHIYEPSDSFDWLINHHRANLVWPISNRDSLNFWIRYVLHRDQDKNLRGRKGFRVDFTELQRMHMRKLQIKLIRHVAFMVDKGQEPESSWEQDLQAYSTKTHKSVPSRGLAANMILTAVKAVQDYDYMVQFIRTRDDPFIASSERRVDHKILFEEMNKAGIDFARLAGPEISLQGAKPMVIPAGPWSPKDEPVWGKRYLSNMRSKLRRFWDRGMALVAAYAFLLTPIVLIFVETLTPAATDTLTANLAPVIIVVSFVAVWVVFMIARVNELKDVVPLTAGYAAVLGIILNSAAALRQALISHAVSTGSG